MLRTITVGSEGPRLLITGGVHGDEFEPIIAIHRLSTTLQERAHHGKLNGQITLVPIVNESAFLRGHRCADDHLDLARTFPGRADGSVTEQTASLLSDLIRHSDYYIDLHTGGTELSVFPLAGYVMHPDLRVLDIQRRMAKAFNLPVVWGTSPNLEGRSLSVARDSSVPAIYCEYLGSATCSNAGVDAYHQGCLNVLAELNLIEEPQPESQVRWTVEDARPNSGHLQICNPAPCAGCFVTSRKLGDYIQAGAPLGNVIPLEFGDGHAAANPVPVLATQSGILLVLRTFPRVRAGDSVGVILETS
jgi:predicted deacylase